ncbi:hypothetical protein K438DRAFT_2131827 [Mycena galopus ATCC 62051]|nr:hypothetical protein K438DRAFT_2131827 [Mycena galopus ATCC 62051]
MSDPKGDTLEPSIGNNDAHMNMDVDQDALGFKLENWDEYGNEVAVGDSLLTEEAVYQGTQFINLEFLATGDATEGNEGEPAGSPGAGEEEAVEDLTEKDESTEVEYNQGVTLNGGEDEDEHEEQEENSKTSLDEALEITDVASLKRCVMELTIDLKVAQHEAERATEELEKTLVKYEEMIRVAEQHKTDLEWQRGHVKIMQGIADERAERIAVLDKALEWQDADRTRKQSRTDRAGVVIDASTTGTMNSMLEASSKTRVRWTGIKPEYEVNATGADHQYPANEHMQLTGRYMVHAVRHMSLWAYSRGVPPAQRMPVQQLAINHYVCPDWFAEFLTEIARNAVSNKRTREYWPTVRKDNIGYDPRFMTHYLQYREIEPRGVEFIDDCYTLSMPHVHGYTLYTALGADIWKTPPLYLVLERLR